MLFSLLLDIFFAVNELKQFRRLYISTDTAVENEKGENSMEISIILLLS